ncbi:MAG: hypothetical protein IK066_05805, partial [Kiritimatiellae bacterium]|nr:hypothetical protein [Kiritimatiellia bacterium]
ILGVVLFHLPDFRGTAGDIQSGLRTIWDDYLAPRDITDACGRLAARGWLRVFRIDNSWALLPPPTPATARVVLRHLASRRFLDASSTSRYYYTRTPIVALRRLLALLDARPFASSGDKPDLPEIWATAQNLLSFAPLSEPFSPALLASPDAPPALFRVLAAHRFHLAAPVGPLLDLWRDRLRSRPTFVRDSAPADFAEYAALCVFAGRPGHLDALPADLPEPAANYLAGCRALFAGDLPAAAKRLAAIDDLSPSPRSDYYLHIVCSLPASNLLSLLATAFAKPSKTRIPRLAARLSASAPSSSWLSIGALSFLRQFRRDHAHSLADLTDTVAAWEYRDSPEPTPYGEAGFIVDAMTSNLSRPAAERYAPTAFRLAATAAPAYPTLAAAWLSAFSWAFPSGIAPEAAALAESLTRAGAAWFRPWGVADNPWQQAVAALDKALPAAPKASAAKSAAVRRGSIVWQVCLCRAGGRWNRPAPLPGDAASCASIQAFFRAPRAPADGSGDAAVSLRVLLGGKYDSVFTDADRALVAALRAAPAPVGPGAAKRYPTPSTPDILLALCGFPAVSARFGDDDEAAPDTPSVSFVRRDLPLSVKSTPSGGMVLSVEPWCLGETSEIALRCVSVSEYAVIPVPRAAHAAFTVFTAFGDPKRGLLEFPKDALPALKPLLPRIAALAPLQGDLAAMGEAADLPRIPGDPATLVRLDCDPDAPSLAVTLHVRPLPGSPLLVLPGAGQPERLVPHKGRSAVLVRDLAAERKAADAVRAALAPFESWQSSPNEWLVDDFAQMLRALDALRALGPAVRLEWLSPRKLSVTAPQKKSWKISAVGGADFWFSVKGEVTLDDGTRATLSDLLDAYANRRGEFVPFGDSAYIRLSAALARRLEALSAAGHKKKDSLALPPAALPFLDAAFDPAADAEAGLSFPKALAQRAAEVRDAFAALVSVPPRLKATLRPYQVEGYTWLSRLAAAGFGACLADDMGLGKTVQIIALLLARAADGPSLVVAPASVCGNWRSELARFAPTLNPVMAWDAGPDDTAAALAAAKPGDVVIAGYGLLVSRADAFAARTWNGVVLDEAQAIKNEETKRARAARRLAARFRVVATGTPVENRLSDVWSLFEFLNPGLLGTPAEFARRFTADGRPAPALKRLLSPLILRRVKRDVLDDLPEKTEITLPVLLSPEERAGYETVRRRALDTLRGDAAQNRISILAELTRLRRYCCHPSLVLGPDSAVPAAKLEALLDLLASLRDNGHRALVFSQFTDFLAIVRKSLDEHSFSHLYLDGQTPSAERARLVDAFQRGEGDFFLVSLRAGGLGLNLTAANYVILLDPWWNPAVEQQAADRAHRIGQKRPVTVYRLVAADTVEERVLALHAEKNALSADLLSDASSPALTPALLLSLFR